MITQYNTIDIALPTRSQPRLSSSHVSNSNSLPHTVPSGRRLPDTSLNWMAGGTASSFSDTKIWTFYCIIVSHQIQTKKYVKTAACYATDLLTFASPFGIFLSFFFFRILTARRQSVSVSRHSLTLPYEPSPSMSPIRYLPTNFARLRRVR